MLFVAGSAVGFKLDSLLKLSDTRARNNKMTLMHYLCKVDMSILNYSFHLLLYFEVVVDFSILMLIFSYKRLCERKEKPFSFRRNVTINCRNKATLFFSGHY